MKAVFLPVNRNPYQHLLKDALEHYGCTVTMSSSFPGTSWLRREASDPPVLHLHWLDGLYMRRYLTPVRLSLFVGRYLYARKLGYKIVWTAHNLLPHRNYFRPMDIFVRKLVMRTADAVIAHCEYAKAELLRMFQRDKPTYIIPIGNYIDVYPVTQTRQEARHSLGIDDDRFVYLWLGALRGNKGIRQFVEAFEATGGEKEMALIAGHCRSDSMKLFLESEAKKNPRIKLNLNYVPDAHMQHYLLSGDAMVFSFEEILTSSSVMLGLSYGLPVVVPALGCLPELVPPTAGLCYDPRKPQDLVNAMTKIKGMDLTKLSAGALEVAKGLDWKPIGQQTSEVYHLCYIN